MSCMHAICQAARLCAACRNALQRPLSHSQPRDIFFLFCIELLVDSNYGAVGLVNSTVITLCTKLSARMLSRDHFCQRLPFTADGHFSISLEWYQSKPGSHEDGRYVNSSCAVNVMRLLGNVSKNLGWHFPLWGILVPLLVIVDVLPTPLVEFCPVNIDRTC